jgi:hypothetical protein
LAHAARTRGIAHVGAAQLRSRLPPDPVLRARHPRVSTRAAFARSDSELAAGVTLAARP